MALKKSNNPLILITQLGKFGDTILSTPLFYELKRIFPESHLTVISSRFASVILKNCSAVDDIIEYSKNPVKIIKLFSGLKKYKYDYYIDIKEHFSKTSKLLKQKVKCNKSLGYSNEKINFDINLKEYLAGKHAVDYAIAPVNYFESMSFQTKQTKSEELSLRAKRSKYEELSLRAKRSNLSVISVPVNLKPILEIPEIILNKFNYLSKISDKKILLVNISAGKIARQLETEKWIDIILSLQKNLFTGIISTKKDFHKAELICNKTYAEYIKAINIYEVASVVSYSDIVLSTDTSLIHIASALNKPVIGLFDNVEWNINKFYPLSDIKEVLISDNPENLKSITTEEIIKSVNGILYKISN